eukprot:6361602-Prymnesium_polylepis.1
MAHEAGCCQALVAQALGWRGVLIVCGARCVQHPENLLLLFGIALVACFFMYASLLFGAIFYCKRRAAFDEADRANEVQPEFSTYSNRRRPTRRPGRVREYNARSAL